MVAGRQVPTAGRHLGRRNSPIEAIVSATGSSAGTHVGWTRSRRALAGTASRYPRARATESNPMNLTLRGPALIDDTVVPTSSSMSTASASRQ